MVANFARYQMVAMSLELLPYPPVTTIDPSWNILTAIKQKKLALSQPRWCWIVSFDNAHQEKPFESTSILHYHLQWAYSTKPCICETQRCSPWFCLRPSKIFENRERFLIKVPVETRFCTGLSLGKWELNHQKPCGKFWSKNQLQRARGWNVQTQTKPPFL